MCYLADDLEEVREHLIGLCDVELDRCEAAIVSMLNTRDWVSV